MHIWVANLRWLSNFFIQASRKFKELQWYRTCFSYEWMIATIFGPFMRGIFFKVLLSTIAVYSIQTGLVEANSCRHLFVRPQIAFQTDRLLLRLLDKNEIGLLDSLIESPGFELLSVTGSMSLKDKLLFKYSMISSGKNKGASSWDSLKAGINQGFGVFEKDTGKFVGVLRYRYNKLEDRISMGRMIMHENRRRGFAGELDMPAMNFLYGAYGKNKFSVYVLDNNVASKSRVEKKSPFKFVETYMVGEQEVLLNRYDYTLKVGE
ncbi:MAG: hypothetical protein CL677_03625 [Bdellovibrionaceae bacterium]|nr:hypothetical protein [Pseudobdellovibrionaceae bacterium]